MSTSKWSKSYIIKPHNTLVPFPEGVKARFCPSYEKSGCPPNMNLLLAMEYGRMWRCENEQRNMKRRISGTKKRINPLEDWKKKQLSRVKRFLFLNLRPNIYVSFS